MDLQPEHRPTSVGPTLPERTKTSQRLKYDAEIKVFQARFGTLENVRQKLGFSRRQMGQLLLVDPSAWTRWHSAGGSPPPHVYRALEWFLILEGKTDLHPKVSDLYVKGTVPVRSDQALSADITQVRAQIQRLKLYLWIAPVASAALVATGFFIFR